MNTTIKKILRSLRDINRDGFTLAEVMVSLFIVVIGVVGTMAFFTNARSATRLARDVTMATTHAEYILEDMRTISALENITNTDWTNFWDTLVNDGTVDSLKNETISVFYDDVDANPLNVTVMVNWDTNSRNSSTSITTEVTR